MKQCNSITLHRNHSNQIITHYTAKGFSGMAMLSLSLNEL